MSLLTELDAFYLEHRKCGELEIDSDEHAARMACSSCGGSHGETHERGGQTMVQATRRALLVVVLLIASIATAAADDLWVQWHVVNYRADGVIFDEGSFATAAACVDALLTTAKSRQSAGVRVAFVRGTRTAVWWEKSPPPPQFAPEHQVFCLPDTIDTFGETNVK